MRLLTQKILILNQNPRSKESTKPIKRQRLIGILLGLAIKKSAQ